jgi:hypothetical protein
MHYNKNKNLSYESALTLASSVLAQIGLAQMLHMRPSANMCLQAFDKGHCSPQLLHLISTGQLKVQGKKAFVPGCG